MPPTKTYTEKQCLACKEILVAAAFDTLPSGTLKKYCRKCQANITRIYLVSKERDEIRMCNTCHMLTSDFCLGKTICRPCRKKQNKQAYERKRALAEAVAEKESPEVKDERKLFMEIEKKRRRKEADEKRDVRERKLQMSTDLRTCVRCLESSHNFTGKKHLCRGCVSAYNNSYHATSPSDRGVGKTQEVYVQKPSHGMIGRWGCFEVMADGNAICDCGTKFVPTNLTFKFSRPCWHIEQQATNRMLERQLVRD